MSRVIIVYAVWHTLAAISLAETFDWPQWQGPDRNAISKETGLLQEWPEDGPPLAWKVTGIGGGYSAPSIADGRLYAMSNRGDDEVVWCLSEADGNEIWVTAIGPASREGGSQGSEGPGCTPTVDGDRLYVIGAGGAVACLHVRDGEIIWQRSLIEDFGGRLPTWRYNESPLVDGEKVVCTPGGEDATLVALDKRSGGTIWTTKVPDAAGGSERSERRRGPSIMRMMPVLAGLDADEDSEISADEIDASPDVLSKLDKNEDGKLTEDEVSPNFGGREQTDRQRESQGQRGGGPGGRGDRGGRGGRGGIMRFLPVHAALDADESGDIDGDEMTHAAAALRKLDRNDDGKLTEDEVSPRFGRRGSASGAGYASAIAIDFQGQRQYVQLTATTLAGVAASDGALVWRYDRPANRNRINCSTPIYHDGLVFAASAYGNGGGAVRLIREANGDTMAEEVYFTTRMQNHHGGMIVFEGALYGAHTQFLACLDFQTGDVLWRERRAEKGSLAMAGGRLYLRTEDGTLILIEPNREEYVERGRFEQPQRSESPAWTHPVIANGRLYVRDQDLLLCYGVKAE